MNIRNYTSTVPISTSVQNIERALVRGGATHISKAYDSDGNISAMLFQIAIPGAPSPATFKLPVRWSACENVLWAEIRRPRPETRKRIHDQAMRTAWKLLHDWVDIQITMILLDQAEIMEVFLPYAWNPGTDRTLYESVKSDGFKLLSKGIEL